jgi:hypothetical protein
MRRALVLIAAICFSQLAAAQTAAGRADSGASTEPQNPADASVSKDMAERRDDKPAEHPKEQDAGAGGTIYATPLPPREPSDKQSEEQKPEESKPPQ